MSEEVLKKFEQTGVLRLLFRLGSNKVHVREVIKSSVNPSGIASEASLKRARAILDEFELVNEFKECTPPYRTNLTLTKKGTKAVSAVLSLLSSIED